MSAGVKYCKHLRHPNMVNIMSFRINKNDNLVFLFILHLQSNEVLIYFVEAYRKVHNGRISFEYWVTMAAAKIVTRTTLTSLSSLTPVVTYQITNRSW